MTENLAQMEEKSPFRKFFDKFHVTIPLTIYTATGFMFLPLFQSMIYAKVCLETYPEHSGLLCFNKSATHKDPVLQKGANFVLLWSSVSHTVLSLLSAPILGSLSDRYSRKIVMIIPYLGLILADITLIAQAHFLHLSAYWLLVSEALFGAFGGYTAIFGLSFAYVGHMHADTGKRSKQIGLLEGCMGLGGTIGYFVVGPVLKSFGYPGSFTIILSFHLLCFVYIAVCLKDLKLAPDSTPAPRPKNFSSLVSELLNNYKSSIQTATKSRKDRKKTFIWIFLLAFALSYFVYQGSISILFYYLKFMFNWGPAKFGYLKGSIHCATTVMTLALYPLLKRLNIPDTTLAIVGLASRMMGRGFLAFAWNTYSVFGLVLFDMFSRFGAAALRALLSRQVGSDEQGKIFALIALIEGAGGLLAHGVFNSLFPISLTFWPRLSYMILSLLMVIPIGFVSYAHQTMKSVQNELPEEVVKLAAVDEKEAENIVSS